MDIERESPIDSVGLPPLRDAISTTSSFRSSSSTPTKQAGRIAVSRMSQSRMEGKPLGLPSEEEQLEEMRHTSPRGFAAFSLGIGLSGSCGDEVWRVKRRVLREPLVPIEETLHKRRAMQKTMSAPVLFGETSESLNKKRVRRRIRASPELAPASTKGSWADSEGSTLVESCVKLCAWEDAAQGKSQYSTAIDFRSNHPLGPRQRPLPTEVLTRMKDTGWNMTGPSCTVWVQQARHLASSRSHAPAAVGSKAIHERLQLLHLLEQHELPQGVEALRFALKWRCGSLEQAFLCLDVGCRQGLGALSMLEFVGALTLLGLDAPAICGASEAVAFTILDADGDGRLSVLDLLEASVPTQSSSEVEQSKQLEGQADHRHVNANGREQWILIVKFVALYAWFATPAALRRRCRGFDALSSQIASPEKLGGGAGGAMTIVTALAGGAIGRSGEHVAIAQQQACDPVMRAWAPSECDLEMTGNAVNAEFMAHCTAQQLGEKLLNKSDFFRFLGDIPPLGVGDDPASQRITRTMLSELFDEALALQAKGPHSSRTKGLTFESFRLLLLKVARAMDLHFRHLVEDAIEAQSLES